MLSKNRKSIGRVIIWILVLIDGYYIFGMLYVLAKEVLRFGEFPKNTIGVNSENIILFFAYNLLLLVLSEIYFHKEKWIVRALVSLGIIIFISGSVAFL